MTTQNQVIWKPDSNRIENANVTRLMKKCGVNTVNELRKKSSDNIDWFWETCLQDLNVEWFKKYDKIREGDLPFASWFVGGKINIVANCLDRHQKTEAKNKTAFTWVGDCGAVKKITYAELFNQVNQFATGLKSLGVTKEDCVALYMPMIPEMVVAFFSVLKIGATVIPIFSGFGPEPTSVRLQDAKVKILITADGSLRRGKKISLKQQADEAVKNSPSVQKVIVAKRLFEDIPWNKEKDLWFDDVRDSIAPSHHRTIAPTEVLNAEHRSLIIYTSGTTGKPKGTVHTHAGVLAQVAKEVTYAMDCKKDDVFFWMTDIGWMMGPWEIIGTTFNGATCVIFEGTPDHPTPERLWELVDQHKISILGLSPTAIRLLKKFGTELPQKYNFSSLKILASTGEAWDTESYLWFFENIGRKKCPIINISGGTEIMGCHLSPLPIEPLKPCTLGGPGLGMDVDVFSEEGKSLRNEVGYLVCKKPAPSMTKGFLNDKQRYLDTYFSKWPKIWNHGDWAIVDEDGFWFLRGRADDVIKVSGHRTGPAEIESALMEHEAIAESAAIGVPHPIKGESIACFIVLKPGITGNDDLKKEIKTTVTGKLGKTLTPDEIIFIPALPKTRSAKIVRKAIKNKYLGLPLGDISSVENPEALNYLR